jgi:5-carboxymethyl-2-hydroxymuconate isomerase
MPHLVILYTPNLQDELNGDVLCRTMADAMLSVRDEQGLPVFPVGGTRVFAMPATHFAVADGSDATHGFVYLNVRMARGRSTEVQQRVGQALADAARAHLAPLLSRRVVGVTLQVDEGAEVFDAKLGNLHAAFARPTKPTKPAG